MDIYIAADHGGFDLKSNIIDQKHANIEANFYDLGSFDLNSVDYPDYAKILCDAMLGKGDDVFGVLICTSGIGMSIAANRYSHIRAALCRDIDDVEMSRRHNNANILVLSAKKIDFHSAICYIKKFTTTAFEAGRHAQRVAKI